MKKGLRNRDDELPRGSGGELDGCRASSWRSEASPRYGNLMWLGMFGAIIGQRDRGYGNCSLILGAVWEGNLVGAVSGTRPVRGHWDLGYAELGLGSGNSV